MTSYTGNISDSPVLDMALDSLISSGYDENKVRAAFELWQEQTNERGFWKGWVMLVEQLQDELDLGEPDK